jgi:DNA-binding MarR family transcriptional regulator
MKRQMSKTVEQPVCLCTNLRRTARAISNIYDAALAPTGIKITQFSLLRAVQRHEPIAISVLAEEMALDRTTLARNLAPLQRDRLLALSAGSDQRVTEVRLTNAGRDAIERAVPLWKKTQHEVSRLLAPGRIARLYDISREASTAAEKFTASGEDTPAKKKTSKRSSR